MSENRAQGTADTGLAVAPVVSRRVRARAQGLDAAEQREGMLRDMHKALAARHLSDGAVLMHAIVHARAAGASPATVRALRGEWQRHMAAVDILCPDRVERRAWPWERREGV